jgi:hypothetical protein
MTSFMIPADCSDFSFLQQLGSLAILPQSVAEVRSPADFHTSPPTYFASLISFSLFQREAGPPGGNNQFRRKKMITNSVVKVGDGADREG